MEPKVVTFKALPNQEVVITANGITGTVLNVDCDRDGIATAFVEYCLTTGEITSRWFREAEFELAAG